MTPRGQSELSEATRGRILALYDEGYTYRQIAEKAGVSHSAVQKTVTRYRIHHTTASLPRSGRPPKISARTRRAVLREVRANRSRPYRVVSENLGIVTPRQVQAIASAAGYHRRVARRKPHIDKPTAKKRLAWASSNEGRDWDTVAWADEFSIETGEKTSRLRVTRRPGEEYLPECIEPTFQSGRQSLMGWGIIAHGYKGPIIRLETQPYSSGMGGRRKGGGITTEDYAKQVIRGPMKDFLEYVEKERGHKMLVVEDGAPAHRGKASQQARHEMGIEQLPHPPRSPDLNPIERLWLLVKTRVAAIPGSKNSLQQLWEAVQTVWEGITIEEINKHTGEMDARVLAVKEVKGRYTRF